MPQDCRPEQISPKGTWLGRHAGWCAPVLLAALTAGAFLPALRGQFLNWDDPANITNNQHYRGLGLEQIRWAFTTNHMGHYQPLSWLSLGLDYVLWGTAPFGYHLTNLLLHICNGLLVYFLALRLLGGWAGAKPGAATTPPKNTPDASLIAGAMLAACLFAVHPLRAESVAWVTERRDVLSGMLYLLTVHLYLAAHLEARRSRARLKLAGAATVFSLALLAKVMSVSLVPVLLILDVYPLGRLGGRRGWLNARTRSVWLEKLPFLIPALAAAGLAIISQGETGSMVPWSQHGLGARLAVCAYGLAFYIYVSVWPALLSPLYELPAPVVPFERQFLVCTGAVAAATFAILLAVRHRPAVGRPLAAVGAAYVVILAPVLGLIQNGPQIVACRYSYLACVGWALLVGALFRNTWRRWARGAGRAGLSVAAAGVVAVLVVLTRSETRTWRDSLTLWTRAVRVDPVCGFCNENLAHALVSHGRNDEAIAAYRVGLEHRPRLELSLNGLATLLGEKGQHDRALELYLRALEIKPEYAGTHYNLGTLLTKMGDTTGAIKHYRLAVEYDPADFRSYGNLGNLLGEANRLDEAIEVYNLALGIRPEALRIRRNLSSALARKGEFAAAEEQLRRLLRLKPDDPEMLNNLGIILDRVGRVDESVEAFTKALGQRPDYTQAHVNLGIALNRVGHKDEAAGHFREALRQAPTVVDARLLLADLLAERSRCAEALRVLADGLALLPGNRRLAEKRALVSSRCEEIESSQGGDAE